MNPSTKKDELSDYLMVGVVVAVVVTLGFCFNNVTLAEEDMLADVRDDIEPCYTDESSCSSCRIQPSAGEMAEEYPFIDILAASVKKTNGSSSLLLLQFKVAAPIPSSPSALTSYSFALDLDGDPGTGFRANRSPLGMFPGLGVDLWVNLSLSRGSKKSFVFLGPKNIDDLNHNAGLLEHSFDQNRKKIVFTIPVEPIERKLTFAYLHKSPKFQVDLDETKWVSFATSANSRFSDNNPLCDFFPDDYFRESDEGCPLRPLL